MLCILDAFVDVGLINLDDFHRISSVVWWGGVSRTVQGFSPTKQPEGQPDVPCIILSGGNLMQTALRMETTVLPGHRLEISAPELPEGAKVEVIVVLPEKPVPTRRSMLEFLATLPPGPLLFKTPEEANRYLQEERDSWER